jgi:protein-L-isoaspartate(D-aspartate) O-methyltransferase
MYGVGKSNVELIEALLRHGVIRDDRVADVMKAVDRADFCPREPYVDSPESIGYNVTIRCARKENLIFSLFKK